MVSLPVQPSSLRAGGAWSGTAIMTEANSDVDPAVVPGKPSGSRRMIHILGAALVGVVLPVVVLYALLGELGSRAMVIGLMVGVIGSKLGRPAGCCISPRRSG